MVYCVNSKHMRSTNSTIRFTPIESVKLRCIAFDFRGRIYSNIWRTTYRWSPRIYGIYDIQIVLYWNISRKYKNLTTSVIIKHYATSYSIWLLLCNDGFMCLSNNCMQCYSLIKTKTITLRTSVSNF